MRVHPILIVFVGLLFIVGITAAAVITLPVIPVTPPGGPLTTSLSQSKLWPVANAKDTSLITINVRNTSTMLPVKGATVQFTVADAPYGTILSPSYVITDASGNANVTFQTTHLDGIARIRADVSYFDSVHGTTVTTITYIDQNVDHDTPYIANWSYSSSGTVATEVPVNITFTDEWGNAIDDRNPAETHVFTLSISGPLPYDGGFKDGAGYSLTITRPIDSTGNLSVIAKLSSKPGHNNIINAPLGGITSEYNWIDAESWGTPYSIISNVDPQPEEIPADGLPQHVYTIQYILTDKYGNPAGSQQVWINTTMPGENMSYTTNSLGQIWVTYGPKSFTGHITLIGTPVANNSISVSNTVGFYNTTATTMDITANPEAMASYDANPSTTSQVIVKIMDVMGNPVPGENVTFSLGTPVYGGGYNVTSNPYLSTPTTAQTDGNGNAVVTFHPGGFTNNTFDPKWTQMATGCVSVFGEWNGNTKSIPLSWKNYPYLSVKTSVNPQQVQLNGSVDVGVQLIGDGWALQPSPIDVVLLTDTSGSMADYGKETAAKNADLVFLSKMSGQDRVGLIQFGKGATTTTSKAILDYNLTSPTSASLTTKINSYTPGSSTPTRSAIYLGDQMLYALGRANAVKAIVLLTDGAWNINGDPSAYYHTASDGSGTYWPPMDFSSSTPSIAGTSSVVTWAKNNNIKIYTVGLGADADLTRLDAYATETGGKAYNDTTCDPTQLTAIYTDIAGQLKTTAGVNTQLTLDFQNISVNNVTVPGAMTFNYTYLPYNATDPYNSSTRLGWQDGVYNDTNQYGQWIASHQLSFNAGTIKIGQQWNSSFRLVVNQTGNIDIFGNKSVIIFNGGASSLTLPHTYITSVGSLTSSGIHMRTIQLKDFVCNPEVGGLIPCEWNTTYNGAWSVQEDVYYTNDGTRWVQFDALKNIDSGGGDSMQATQLPMTHLPPGQYKFKIIAVAQDADDAIAVTGPVSNEVSGVNFIKLE